MTRSGFPVPMRALLSCQSRSTWRATAALDASGPSRSRAIDQSDSPVRTTWVRSPRRARRPRTRAFVLTVIACVGCTFTLTLETTTSRAGACPCAGVTSGPTRTGVTARAFAVAVSSPSVLAFELATRAGSAAPRVPHSCRVGSPAVSGLGVLAGGGGADVGGTAAVRCRCSRCRAGSDWNLACRRHRRCGRVLDPRRRLGHRGRRSVRPGRWRVLVRALPLSSLSATGGPEAAGAAGVSNGSWVDGPPGSKSGLSVGSLAVTSWGGAVPSLCWSGSPAIATGAAAGRHGEQPNRDDGAESARRTNDSASQPWPGVRGLRDG